MTEKKNIVKIHHEGIPVKRKNGSVRDEKHLKVAAYARVSTLAEEQEESYEAQVKYYTEFLSSVPEWVPVGIYTDNGKSGTQAKNRPGFMKMIQDARKGKIDLIFVKSISRFGRNCFEAQKYSEELKKLNVEIRFQEEGISSYDANAIMVFQFLCAVAENESRSISQNVRWTYEKLAARGIRHLGNNRVFGYDEIDGVLTPNEDAAHVKFIYESFAEGVPLNKICQELKNQGAKRMRSKKDFDATGLRAILRNEIYVGDRILQKDYHLDHKTHEADTSTDYYSYYLKDDHEGTVSREIWEIVQKKLDRRDELNKIGIRSSKEPHIFMGRVFCGKCGSFMKTIGDRYKGKYQTVWKCADHAKGLRGNGCKNSVIPDFYFLQRINSFLVRNEEADPNSVEEKYEEIERIEIYDEWRIKVITKNPKPPVLRCK